MIGNRRETFLGCILPFVDAPDAPFVRTHLECAIMSKSFSDTFRTHIRQMLPFHVFVLVHTAIVLGIAASLGTVTPLAYMQHAAQLGPLYFILLPLVLALAKALLRFSGYQGTAAADLSLSMPILFGRLASAAVTLGMIMLFMGSFTTFKTLMPVLMGGFPYDRILADIDIALHGGIDPGLALANLLDSPLLLQGCERNEEPTASVID